MASLCRRIRDSEEPNGFHENADPHRRSSGKKDGVTKRGDNLVVPGPLDLAPVMDNVLQLKERRLPLDLGCSLKVACGCTSEPSSKPGAPVLLSS
ncbi:unnamed protein product [Lota lota]